MLIHYTKEGADAVDDEFLRWGRESLEYAWIELIEKLGWKRPPPDAGEGGDGRYDVYIMSFGDPENPNPNTFNRGVTIPDRPFLGISHIIINADIRPGADPSLHPLNSLYSETTVRSVFGHELVHACQMAYGPVLEGFLSENTATYHQLDLYGLLYSDDPRDILLVQTLLHLRFGMPAFSLHSLFPLLAYVPTWSKYLVDSRKGDRTILNRIYGEIALDSYRGMYDATDKILTETGGDLKTDFQTYAEWNYKTGPHTDGTGYEDAEMFPTLWGSVNVTFKHGQAPVHGESGAHSPRSMGSNYISFAPDPSAGDGIFRFHGGTGIEWGLSILAKNSRTGIYDVSRLLFGPESTEASIVMEDWNTKQDIVAVVSNLTFTGILGSPAGSYKYEIEAIAGDRIGSLHGSSCSVVHGLSAKASNGDWISQLLFVNFLLIIACKLLKSKPASSNKANRRKTRQCL